MIEIILAHELAQKDESQLRMMFVPRMGIILTDLDMAVANRCGYVFLCRQAGHIIAWALAYLHGATALTFQCYVSESHRRQGIGLELYRAVGEFFPEAKISHYYHDRASRSFFKKADKYIISVKKAIRDGGLQASDT